MRAKSAFGNDEMGKLAQLEQTVMEEFEALSKERMREAS
jgi:hypothetical protein